MKRSEREVIKEWFQTIFKAWEKTNDLEVHFHYRPSSRIRRRPVTLRYRSVLGSKPSVRTGRGTVSIRYSKVLCSRPSSRPGRRPLTLRYINIIDNIPSSMMRRR
jgi:hypothetical protein